VDVVLDDVPVAELSELGESCHISLKIVVFKFSRSSFVLAWLSISLYLFSSGVINHADFHNHHNNSSCIASEKVFSSTR
jgi:hypothetical protein